MIDEYNRLTNSSTPKRVPIKQYANRPYEKPVFDPPKPPPTNFNTGIYQLQITMKNKTKLVEQVNFATIENLNQQLYANKPIKIVTDDDTKIIFLDQIQGIHYKKIRDDNN